MSGTLRIAYKLLVNDRGKFAVLLTGITFAVFLIVQMTSLFAGILGKAASTVTNTGARMWVMDPSVNNVLVSVPMPDYVLDVVRSTPGVRYAVPLFSGSGLVKRPDGIYQPVTVIGLDDTTLLGRPRLIEGEIADIFAENGFIAVADAELGKLGNLGVGSVLEINDNRAVIVGLAEVPESGLFGTPTLYTTYSRAKQYLPATRNTIAYVLVEPQSAADIPAIKRAVDELGYLALTEREFVDRITSYYTWETGLGTNILLMTVISFIIGLSISGQTFYSFALENLDKFGALKAIGASRGVLIRMLLFQAGLTALVGYGLGIGLVSLMVAIARLRLPEYASIVTFGNLALALGMVAVIAGASSYFAMRRVLRVDPFEVFRS